MHMAIRQERQPASAQAIDTVRQALGAMLGNRLVSSLAVRQQHANTLTWIDNQAPDLVVYPQTTEEVSAIVKLCAAHDVPVVPFGTGTSFEGHVNAPFGGVSVDTSMMKGIIAVHAEDLDCVIEPGVTRKMLNEHLRDVGLFFPIDPGADASLGVIIISPLNCRSAEDFTTKGVGDSATTAAASTAAVASA